MARLSDFINHFDIDIDTDKYIGEVFDPTFEREKSRLFCNIKLNRVLALTDYHEFNNKFIDGMSNHFKQIEYHMEYPYSKDEKSKIIDYIKSAMVLYNNSEVNRYLNMLLFNISDNTWEVEITVPDQQVFNIFNTYKSWIINDLKKYGFSDAKINFKVVEIKHQFQTETVNIDHLIQEQNVAIESNQEAWKTKSYYTLIPIKDLAHSEEINVEINGYIFQREDVTTKNGNKLIKLSLTDYGDAISAIIFLNNNKNEIVHECTEGKSVNIKGKINVDRSQTKVIYVSSIKLIDDIFSNNIDRSPSKHNELGFHTKMSTMDGILNPEEIFERAKLNGHKVVGFTDTNSLQYYPQIHTASKKYKDIKTIYGVSLSVVEPGNGVLINYQERFANLKLDQVTYVAFDFETTGLSPIADELTEFGAVLIKDNKIFDRKQFFIKSSKPIPQSIIDFNSITQAMSDGGMELEDAIKEIKEYFADHVILAHNANFDYSLLVEKAARFGITFDNLFIDTVQTSRLISPTAKGNKLEQVAKRNGVVYNKDDAHRGDYDADVLAQIWIKQIEQFFNLEIYDFNSLKNYVTPTIEKYKYANELSIWVKNKTGLKDLYNTMTQALTTYFYNDVKYPITDIKRHGNLIIGSGGVNGPLMNALFYRSQSYVEKLLDKFDYIEIPPLAGMSHLLVKRSLNDVKYLIKTLIDLCIKHNKPMFVSAQPRYLNEREKMVHEIYICATGIGKKHHNLFVGKKDSDAKNEGEEGEGKASSSHVRYPDQHYFTTKDLYNEFSWLGSKYKDVIDKMILLTPLEIANQIETFEVFPKDLYAPKFDDSHIKLKNLVYENAYKQYGNPLPERIAKRIERELTPILKYGFDVVYWISSYLVKKSNEDGYIVGSRGSVGSSIVATLSGITEVNPLEPHYYCVNCQYSDFPENPPTKSGYDLPAKNCPNCNHDLKRDGQTIPFETFLGFDADKVPDIDLNFSGEYQPTIHNAVRTIFGASHTLRAGTIAKVADKTAFGYARNHFPESLVSNAFVGFLAKKIVNVKRTTGQHPGGILIIPKEYDVEDFTPINFPADDIDSDWKTSHFDFHALHDNILKLDLLGHDAPTSMKMLEKLTGITVNQIPENDPKVISIFQTPEALGIEPKDISGESTGALGIPEFGTPFVRKMLKKAKPKSFADLVSISGLSHGENVWNDNAELLIDKGLSLAEVVSCRDDIMTDLIEKGVDQKQAFIIMEQVRKNKGITPEQKKMLLDTGVTKSYTESLEKIKYLFPKAHATAYVLMGWRDAYFKVYYPLAYYATYFSVRAKALDIKAMVGGEIAIKDQLTALGSLKLGNKPTISAKQINQYDSLLLAQEANARGIKFLAVDIHRSLAKEWLLDEATNSLIAPFNAIDGLGDNVAEKIIEARNQKEFISFEDFAKRSGANKTNIELMKEIGSFNNLDESNQNTLW